MDRRTLTIGLTAAFVLGLVALYFGVRTVRSEDLYLTIGQLPESTRDQVAMVRGTRTPGAYVEIRVDGVLQAAGNPAGALYRAEVTLEPGENQITASVAQNGQRMSEHIKIFRRTASFADTNEHWARESIEVLATLGIINGVGNGSFAPEASVTRAQFAKMVVQALGIRPETSVIQFRFRDAADIQDWAGGYVAAAMEHDLLAGFDDRTFRPNQPITRVQMAVIGARALRARGYQPDGTLPAFSDQAGIPAWAEADVALAARAGVISGYEDGTFRPDGRASRAQAAVMAYRLRKLLG